ncbi:hypothetical protein P168DRAFT_315236 [Aspergillus campestris IBT 28561]|uniref:Resolvase HTH domain-containing protein n=1 Tax=Aspergillus campestris (strain IBT 28561) TaxID=1392248 RepID=A0A2I1DH79_ASPC2|nr:uncharacterized protein P168DRAFT_315236 [Aspergillus campestris IBT 28561]PKY09219.1 hypothetical protein P168DRAFT_315236 [Aspergillus campestris IBT 28561]
MTFSIELTKPRKPNTELSSEIRASILPGLQNKIPAAQLAKQFGVSRTTIYATRQPWDLVEDTYGKRS